MRSSVRFLALVVAGVSALVLMASPPGPARAEEIRPAEATPAIPSARFQPQPRDFKALLDENDEIAALEAIRVALSEVGDGSTFVWHRRHGRLSGLVQPTSSFKDPAGRICRHILLIMNSGGYTGRTEGVACRLEDGRWQLEG
jgi:hypothetical protein